MSIEEWHKRLPAILTDLYKVARALGGTISGEHGIGHKRSRYLPLVQDPVLIALQQRIKRAFDPLNILNPGKIFPPA
jgi:glycolate oxidase